MIVFFGMDGTYSATLLSALAATEVCPTLVVIAAQQPPTSRSPLVRLETNRPRPGESGKRSAQRGEGETRFATSVRLGELAHDLGIDALTTSDPDALRARAELNARAPEAFVVGGFPRLLSRQVLALPRRGGINVHPGRLPTERGPSPVFWALREGRTRLGFTVHMLDAGEDTGDIISGGEYAIEPGTDLQDVLRRCALSAAPQMVRAVRGLLAGDLVRIPQPRDVRARCPRPGFRDGRIDPSKPAEAVLTFVAGCARSHSLFVEIAGDRFFVAGVRSCDPRRVLPCEYILTGDRMLLRTNPGVVELELKDGGVIFSAEYEEEEEEEE
ncbi:MAG: hypothetical protein IT384_28015 [Deltaproteobacteria bacterium]|nr:hypothetical protein [Deltaproteobacteria bacterium]